MSPVFLREVDAKNSILEEISQCQEAGSRSLEVEIGEVAIPHIAREIYSALDRPNQSLADFIASFRNLVKTGDAKTRHPWRYFDTKQPGHIGVILLPKDQNIYFDIITDHKGERILKYRYWKYH